MFPIIKIDCKVSSIHAALKWDFTYFVFENVFSYNYCQILVSVHEQRILVEYVHHLVGNYRSLLESSPDICLLISHYILDSHFQLKVRCKHSSFAELDGFWNIEISFATVAKSKKMLLELWFKHSKIYLLLIF